MGAGLDILRLLRVKQWIKNAFVLVPLIFSLSFMEWPLVIRAFAAFFAFCFASSFVYILNDIADKRADANHPKKKNRLIASGKISVPFAVAVDLACLLAASLLIAWLGDVKVLIALAGYIALNFLYSWWLKHIPLVDVFCIAFGFILRVYVGAYAVGTTVSSFLFMVMLFMALFLAFGKRKSELTKSQGSVLSRSVLGGYSAETVDKYITLLAGATIISYALYTLDPNTLSQFGNRLIYSVIFVVYGIFRYMAQLDKSSDYDDPTDNLYKDKTLILAIAAYVVYVVLIVAKVV